MQWSYHNVFVRTVKRITFADVQKLCTFLSAELGGNFRPECITNGGILWAGWPGCEASVYRSIRFDLPPYTNKEGWPMLSIEGNLATTDYTAEEVVVFAAFESHCVTFNTEFSRDYYLWNPVCKVTTQTRGLRST